MICTKCGVDKDETNYQKYFHSTQQKWRTRKECTDCYYKTRLKRKNPDLYYKNNPNYKKCNTCGVNKVLEQYYFHCKAKDQRFGRCIECQRKKDREQSKLKKEEQGGSLLVLMKPNTYVDEYQKENTFQLMKSIGWSFNEENGVWWKEGIKSKDGVFINIPVTVKKIYRRRPPKKQQPKYSQEVIDGMKQLRKKGETLQSIADKYDCSPPTVIKYIKYEAS
jgi:hypothetical protein